MSDHPEEERGYGNCGSEEDAGGDQAHGLQSATPAHAMTTATTASHSCSDTDENATYEQVRP